VPAPQREGAREAQVGDLVRVRSTAYAEALEVSGLEGVVLEPRSAHSLVFFDERQASYWIPNGAVRVATAAEAAAAAPLVRLLGSLLTLLEATEVQVDPTHADVLIVEANHGAVTLATVEAVRPLFGAALESFTIQPGGMAFMTSIVRFRRP
jgi:hypothetical protein